MFVSKVFTYKDVFELVKAEAESYKNVPDKILLLACNTELQYLYSQVIKRQAVAEGYLSDTTAGSAQAISFNNGEEIHFEDVVSVKVNGENLMHTYPKNASAYDNAYYEGADGSIMAVLNKAYNGAVEVHYVYRPNEVNSVTDESYVQFPTEYIPMLLAAIRTEAYKYIHEDAMSAKWASDYNAYREGFDKWIESTRPAFG